MPEPKTRAELGESLANLLGAGTSQLLVDPATRKAAISNSIDHQGLPVPGTGPRLLRTRPSQPPEPEPSKPPAAPEPPEPSPPVVTTPQPAEPSRDERLEELGRDIARTKAELAMELLPYRVAGAVKRAVERQFPKSPTQTQQAQPEDKKSKHQAACEAAIRQYGAARTPEEIDAAVTRLGELAGEP